MKNETKKKSLGAVFGLAGLLICALAPSAALARGPGERIEGVWTSDVTITDCSSGTILATFHGLGMFIHGGSLSQTNNMNPALASPSAGHWEFLGGRSYSASFQFFRFDTTGTWTGTQKVSRDITLDSSGDTFTSVISFTTYDVNGNVIASGCGTETATRVVD
jgi:hypothetical protein